MYQLSREFWSLNGLAVLCISVDCVRLGVLWRFSRLVVICLFDLILYVHSTIFQLCGTNLPGLNQY